MRRVLILGATSAVARAVAVAFAGQGHQLFLGARNQTELDRIQADLRVRFGVPVDTGVLEAGDVESHPTFIKHALTRLGGLDVVVFAIGLLGEQPEASHDPARALELIRINFSSSVSLLAPLADFLEEQQQGAIVGISSVAGDRARQSKYVYDAAKGGLSLYLQGLRNRLEPSGVRVYTVKPGFVDTSMTYGLPDLFLVAQPEQVAHWILKMLGKRSGIYYMPWFWRWIMLIIKLIPESIFKKMKM